jgi:hypothetical protein
MHACCVLYRLGSQGSPAQFAITHHAIAIYHQTKPSSAHTNRTFATSNTHSPPCLQLYGPDGTTWPLKLPPSLTALDLTNIGPHLIAHAKLLNSQTYAPAPSSPAMLDMAALAKPVPGLQHLRLFNLRPVSTPGRQLPLALATFHDASAASGPEANLASRLYSSYSSITCLHLPHHNIVTSEDWQTLLQLHNLADLQLGAVDVASAPISQPASSASLLAQAPQLITAEHASQAWLLGSAAGHVLGYQQRGAAQQPGMLTAGLCKLRSLQLRSADLHMLLRALRGHGSLASLYLHQCSMASSHIWSATEFSSLQGLVKVVVKGLGTKVADMVLRDVARCSALQQLWLELKELPVQQVAWVGGGVGLTEAGLQALAAGACSRALRLVRITGPPACRPSKQQLAGLLASSLGQRLTRAGKLHVATV